VPIEEENESKRGRTQREREKRKKHTEIDLKQGAADNYHDASMSKKIAQIQLVPARRRAGGIDDRADLYCVVQAFLP